MAALNHPTPIALLRACVPALLCLYAVALHVSVSAAQILVGAILVVALASMAASGEPRLRRTPLDAPFLLLLVAVVLSRLDASVPLVSWRELAPIWLILGYFGVAWVRPTERQSLLAARVFVATGAIVAAYGVVQHFTGLDLVPRPATFRLALADFSTTRYRSVGFSDQGSSFAFVQMIAFAVGLGLATARGASIRLRIGFGACLVPILGAVLFSDVRAAWMGVGVAVVGVVLHRMNLRTLLVAGALVAVAAGVVVASPPLREKATRFFDPAYSANAGRLFIWSRALEMVSDHPVFGTGFGTYTRACRPYYDRHNPAFQPRCHAHNNFFHYWVETGPIGLVAFVWVFVSFFALLLRFRTSPIALLGLLAIASAVVFSMTQDPFFDTDSALCAWFVAGLAMAAGAQRGDGGATSLPTGKESISQSP